MSETDNVLTMRRLLLALVLWLPCTAQADVA